MKKYGNLIYIFLYFLQKVIAVMVTPWLVSALGPAIFGETVRIGAIISFLILLTTFAVDEAIGVAYSKESNDTIKNGGVASFLFLYALSAAVIFLIAIVVALSYAKDEAGLWMGCITFILCTPVLSIKTKILKVNSSPIAIMLYGISNNALLVLAALLTIKIYGNYIESYYISQAVVQFIFAAYICYRFFCVSKPNIDIVFAKKLYVHAMRLAPHTLIGWGLVGFNTWYVSSKFDTEWVAQIGVGLFIYSIFISFVDVASTLVQPKIYAHLKANSMHDSIGLKFGYIWVIVFLIMFASGIFLVFGDILILHVFPGIPVVKFEIIFSYTVAASLLGMRSVLVYPYYHNKDRSLLLSKITLSGVFLNVILTVGFIAIFGEYGGLASIVVVMLYMLTAVGVFSHSHMGIGYLSWILRVIMVITFFFILYIANCIALSHFYRSILLLALLFVSYGFLKLKRQDFVQLLIK